MHLRVEKDKDLCQNCFSCETLIPCPVNFQEDECIGCGACTLVCPFGALKMVEGERKEEIPLEIDGENYLVYQGITLKAALESLGHKVAGYHQGVPFAPCGTGGCYTCALEGEGEIKRACVTGVEEGMKIKTRPSSFFTPGRIVGGFMGHGVGGVGTPWDLKGQGYAETVLFTAGCNFRCPQCQNWTTAFRGKENVEYRALTPEGAAEKMTKVRKEYRVNRMAISGGECTLNQEWLLGYLKELKKLNPDGEARFHVDTNGSLLTGDYLEELIRAGMTDMGIDLKGLKGETFRRITGLDEDPLAKRYLDNAWQGVKYLRENYRDRVFLGLGLPYNPDLISLEEIKEIGQKISEIDPYIQVCPLDYRPSFRRRDLERPSYSAMEKVYRVLKGAGLKTVICQTAFGFIGP